eukprot:TRINITY_DN17106_c0_g1_i3.p1 TRINITY_DN17106_c0_g1~~TRINITY_DN17106_c0_g1_i3.p1  ORF type:complete len:273 (+),score=13.87 TRINITY_DN17106_c0_g1_i3:141-959(+)
MGKEGSIRLGRSRGQPQAQPSAPVTPLPPHLRAKLHQWFSLISLHHIDRAELLRENGGHTVEPSQTGDVLAEIECHFEHLLATPIMMGGGLAALEAKLNRMMASTQTLVTPGSDGAEPSAAPEVALRPTTPERSASRSHETVSVTRSEMLQLQVCVSHTKRSKECPDRGSCRQGRARQSGGHTSCGCEGQARTRRESPESIAQACAETDRRARGRDRPVEARAGTAREPAGRDTDRTGDGEVRSGSVSEAAACSEGTGGSSRRRCSPQGAGG